MRILLSLIWAVVVVLMLLGWFLKRIGDNLKATLKRLGGSAR